MDTARLFQSGRSQAVRLPKEYRFAGTEVVVKHFGNGVLLLPVDDPWKTLEAGLAAFEPGFVLTREQPPVQERADIDIAIATEPAAPAPTASARRP
jgi:antitoxin VapB